MQNPKSNGYRSLHLIVDIPVFFSQGKEWMRVEIQIRTAAMNFWASLEHQLQYKANVPEDPEIRAELLDCAERIAETDERMVQLRNRIYQVSADKPADSSESRAEFPKNRPSAGTNSPTGSNHDFMD